MGWRRLETWAKPWPPVIAARNSFSHSRSHQRLNIRLPSRQAPWYRQINSLQSHQKRGPVIHGPFSFRLNVDLLTNLVWGQSLCINLRASVTGVRQVIEHLPQRHITCRLALKSCSSLQGSHFTVPQASPLAFHWLLIGLALRRWFLARRNCKGVTTDMTDNVLSQRFFDQGHMYLPCEVVFGKFRKGPRN